MRGALLLCLLLPLEACKSGTDAASSAAIMTAIAASSSAVSRANGGCYATCTHGTICNSKSGLCERLPCRGQCSQGETCDPVRDECVRKSDPPAMGLIRAGLPGDPNEPTTPAPLRRPEDP